MKTLTSLFTLSALALTFNAQAAGTGTATLQLNGSVTQACTIAVNPTAKATSLDIKAGETSTSVASVTEDCNSGTGYTVNISSANSGKLMSVPGDDTKPLAQYNWTYSDGVMNGGLMTATRPDARFGFVNDLIVNVTGNPQAIAGNYSDTLTLTIAAK